MKTTDGASFFHHGGGGGGGLCVCSRAFSSLNTLRWLHPVGTDFCIGIKRSNRLKGYQVSIYRPTSPFRGPWGPTPLGYFHDQRLRRTVEWRHLPGSREAQLVAECQVLESRCRRTAFHPLSPRVQKKQLVAERGRWTQSWELCRVVVLAGTKWPETAGECHRCGWWVRQSFQAHIPACSVQCVLARFTHLCATVLRTVCLYSHTLISL